MGRVVRRSGLTRVGLSAETMPECMDMERKSAKMVHGTNEAFIVRHDDRPQGGPSKFLFRHPITLGCQKRTSICQKVLLYRYPRMR